MSEESYVKKLRVGDLVTSGWRGYWVVEKIERQYYTQSDILYWPGREEGKEYDSLLYIRQVACSNFKSRKSKTSQLCSEICCKKVDAEALIDKETEVQRKRWNNLANMIKEYISEEII